MNKNKQLKTNDIQAVRKCFYKGGLQTKTDISHVTGISMAGVTNVLQELVTEGEILYVSDAASTGGRRSKQYSLNPDYRHIALISCIRQDDAYYYVLSDRNLQNEELASHVISSRTGSIEDFETGINWLKEKDPLIHVCTVSLPGICENGIVRLCDFHKLEGKNIGAIAQRAGDWTVENDVNTACIGLSHQNDRCKNLALIYQPSTEYAGTGILIHGRLYSGINHMAGEMRFMADERPGNALVNKTEGLWRDICAIQAVLDPQMIGWCSDLVSEEEFKKYCKNRGFTGRLFHINDMNALISKGLYEMGRELVLKSERMEEI